MDKALRIGMIAAEPSGDLLGGQLIEALRALQPDLIVEGIAGPEMRSAGCHALFPVEQLSVMGIVEVLRHLPRLLRIRRQIIRHFLENPPDVLIGIDAPDFNLPIEAVLKKQGIPTVHYTSPTVWAWRRRRLKSIAKATDLMLALYPFEAAFYEERQIPVRFVGHPLADMIPMEIDSGQARAALNLPLDKKIVAILPGSRVSEIARLGPVFIETARWCRERVPDIHFVVPTVNAERRQQFALQLKQYGPELPFTLFDGQSREVMAASDAVLVASGTATLEALLLRRPMVVAYRLSTLSYWIAKCLVKIDKYSLPNLLAENHLVKEFIQNEVTPANLGPALLDCLNKPELRQRLDEEYKAIHCGLRRGASQQAAQAILGLVALKQAGKKLEI